MKISNKKNYSDSVNKSVFKLILSSLSLLLFQSTSYAFHGPWANEDISFKYLDTPVSKIVANILVVSVKPVKGLEQLDSHVVSHSEMRNVNALKAVTILLKCEGFRMYERPEHYEIVKDPSIDRAMCLVGI